MTNSFFKSATTYGTDLPALKKDEDALLKKVDSDIKTLKTEAETIEKTVKNIDFLMLHEKLHGDKNKGKREEKLFEQTKFLKERVLVMDQRLRNFIHDPDYNPLATITNADYDVRYEEIPTLLRLMETLHRHNKRSLVDEIHGAIATAEDINSRVKKAYPTLVHAITTQATSYSQTFLHNIDEATKQLAKPNKGSSKAG